MSLSWGQGTEFGVMPLVDGRTYWYAAANAGVAQRNPDELEHLRRTTRSPSQSATPQSRSRQTASPCSPSQNTASGTRPLSAYFKRPGLLERRLFDQLNASRGPRCNS